MKRVCLVILDGWGIGGQNKGNAILAAKTPNWERLWHENLHMGLAASGEAIGLPKNQMGTSETGHMTIGAGRVLFQDLVRINQAIVSGEFFKNQAILKLMKEVKKKKTTLHLLGLLSDGGVHSHYSHLYALLKMAKDQGLKKIAVHIFTDGRDCRTKSGLGFIEDLERQTKIASISGRYYAMDRDHNWARTDRCYKLLVIRGQSLERKLATEIIRKSYEAGITDEFIKPTRTKDFKPIKSGDGAIFFNFRNDRPRQLLERFLAKGPREVSWLTMTRYKPEYPVGVAFSPVELTNCLGEILANNKIRQLRVTETEKFAHLTFFLNCKREEPFEGEDRILLDSNSDITTHDQKPEMRAEAITEEIIQAMIGKTHQVIFGNLCNADMVGHTANFKATVKAIETIDQCLGKLSESAKAEGYDLMITADHGNAEELKTSHTINPVPLIIQSKKFNKLNRDEGNLADIAPTVLKILGIDQPKEMTGRSLV